MEITRSNRTGEPLVTLGVPYGSDARLGQDKYPVSCLDGVTLLIPKKIFVLLLTILAFEMKEQDNPDLETPTTLDMTVDELLKRIEGSHER